MEKLKNKKVLAIVLLVVGIIIIMTVLFFRKDGSVEPKPNPETGINTSGTSTNVDVVNGNVISGKSEDLNSDSTSTNPNQSEPVNLGENNNNDSGENGSTPKEDTSKFPKPVDVGVVIEQKNLLDFTIKTTQQEKIIENKEQGSTFTVSKNFQEEIMDRGGNGKNLRFLDQEAEQQQKINPWVPAGCVLEVFVNENPDNLTLNQWNTLNLPGGVISQKAITINGVPAKLITGDEDGLYNLVRILNPANSSVHEIVAYPHNLDSSGCLGEFNKVIESYSFTNI